MTANWRATMQNNVREMTDEKLVNRFLDHEQRRVVMGDVNVTKAYPYRDELYRRLKVMRELCEAAGSIKRRLLSRGEMLDFAFETLEAQDKFGNARAAYRAMKGEQNAMD